jgi:hypothetical protein
MTLIPETVSDDSNSLLLSSTWMDGTPVKGVPVQAEETIRKNPSRRSFCLKFAHMWPYFCESKSLFLFHLLFCSDTCVCVLFFPLCA